MNKPRLLCSLSLALALALALAQSLPFSTPSAAQSAQPAPASSVALEGLRARVTVRRDGRGIPHIEAASDDDLYFAQGYVTAQDRLWQMDLLRRTARGELAEIFGRPALEEDKRHRAYGFAQLSEGLEANASPTTRRVLEAYARGVNAYVESRDGAEGRKLPTEFLLLGYKPRAWRPADSFVVGKIFAETLSTSWPTDLIRASLADLPAARRAQLLPESSPLDVLVVGSDEADHKPGAKRERQSSTPASSTPKAAGASVVIPSADLMKEAARLSELTRSSLERIGLFMEHGAVSNNWVVSGKRTASGKPLLANDPHLPPSAPSIWHMAHLKAPGINVAGVTAPGAAGIILGHNEHVAWGATNLGPDVQDLYLEKFAADKPNTYQTPEGPREAVVRREEIKVRKGFIGTATDTVGHDVVITRHGPIILEQAGARYALRWTALDPQADEFDAFYKLNRARDWGEFRTALSDYRGPVQNFVYADARGHIGYYGAGRIPTRRTGDGSTPYDGATDAGEWSGYIPFAELPHVYDPPSGLIVTANSRVVGRSYPHHLTHEWAEPYRSRRIQDLLKDKPRLTAEDFRAVQGDTYSIGGAAFARESAKLLKALIARGGAAGQPTTDEGQLRAAFALLEGWDGRVVVESRAAPLVAEMRRAFRRRVLSAALGAERAGRFSWGSDDLFLNRIIAEQSAEWLPKENKDYSELVSASLAESRASLTTRLGADESQWTWGRYAQARFAHPLAAVPMIGQQFQLAPFPLNGSGGAAGATVNVGAGVSMRLIADTADWDKTQQGIALGVSGDPASPHWSDQLADWRAVTPRPFPFTDKAVAAEAKVVLELKPSTVARP